jgi:hypothetical protein
MNTTTVALPAPQFPMMTRMISNSLLPDGGREEPTTWVVSQPHPLVPDMKVVRMFVDRGGVEVYAVSSDGKNGMRNLIPMSWVRLVEEVMPLEVFVEELAAAESEPDDDDDDDGDGDGNGDGEPSSPPDVSLQGITLPPNGQPAS